MPSEMKRTKGLEMLVRKEQLSQEEWIVMVRARRDMVLSCINKVSLKTLGDVQDSLNHTLGDGNSDKDWPNLAVQGLYDGLVIRNGKPNSIWGFTRSGEWVFVELETGRDSRSGGVPCEIILSITRSPDVSIISEKADIHPYHFWSFLGKMIRDMFEQRKKLYQDLLSLQEQIDIEDYVYSHIPMKYEVD